MRLYTHIVEVVQSLSSLDAALCFTVGMVDSRTRAHPGRTRTHEETAHNPRQPLEASRGTSPRCRTGETEWPPRLGGSIGADSKEVSNGSHRSFIGAPEVSHGRALTAAIPAMSWKPAMMSSTAFAVSESMT